MVIREIDPKIISIIQARSFYVLRRKIDGSPLNVSYTPDGLRWTTNKLGRALMYKRGFVSKGKIMFPTEDGREWSKDVYIEKFIPRNHKTESAQVAELTWTTKALKLWY